MIERLRIREELTEEQYSKVLKVIERMKSKFPTSFSRKTKTGEKISFIDTNICGGLNFDILVGVREKPFVVVEVEGKKAMMAFGIMKYLLEEAGVEYSPECDGSEAYAELKKVMKAKNLFDFLGGQTY
ncbi:hypothetical protein [Pyrococcus abyssi]|uniref:Uncharacterized protein n=1 Tax=Pyrococcus abyssi (strain GE5 / Orsay) TaxID=272844 RepID=Q9UZR0_PYRAB|nr:hypothetical protein [Pyrococcus abyssi]CAB49996.1 Hypothetical protein PAB1650 [Pyrococcus abyssi GE5]CCE70497.1 TPA: hypothetical protein PAB1650 [Pyrococcus abyssi GE5]